MWTYMNVHIPRSFHSFTEICKFFQNKSETQERGFRELKFKMFLSGAWPQLTPLAPLFWKLLDIHPRSVLDVLILLV